MRRVPLILLLLAVAIAFSSAVLAEDAPSISLTILQDNYVHDAAFRREWGFACLVTGLEKTILFDTGGFKYALEANMLTAAISAADIDTIVLSHVHQDHIRGFACLLPLPRDMELFLPSSFTTSERSRFEVPGAVVSWVDAPTEICRDAMTTGEMGGAVIEQSLALRTAGGLVIVTGCAHPGIVEIVEAAHVLFPREPIALVLGGFHLLRSGEATIRAIAERLREMGVRRIAPTHCSEDLARDVFREVFGADYIEAGVGLVLKL